MPFSLTLDALKCDRLGFDADRVDVYLTVDGGERQLVWGLLLPSGEALEEPPEPYAEAGQSQTLDVGPLVYDGSAKVELEVRPAYRSEIRAAAAKKMFEATQEQENLFRCAPLLGNETCGHYTLRFTQGIALGVTEVTTRVLNVRRDPEVRTGNKVGQLSRGERVVVLEEQAPWLKVAHDGRRGWVHGDYTTWEGETDASGEAVPDSGGGGAGSEALYEVQVTCNTLNVRAQPSASSTRRGQTRQGERHQVYEESSPWLGIDFNGRRAWIHSDYVDQVFDSGGGSSDPAGGTASTMATDAGIPAYRYFYKWSHYLGGNPTGGELDQPISRAEVLIRRGPTAMLYGVILWGRLFAVDAEDLLPYLGSDSRSVWEDAGFQQVAARLRDAVGRMVDAALDGGMDPYYSSTALPAGDGYTVWVDYHLLFLEEHGEGTRARVSADHSMVHRDYVPPIPAAEGEGWEELRLPNSRTHSPVVRLGCRRFAFFPRLLDTVGGLRRELDRCLTDLRRLARPGIFVHAIWHLAHATLTSHPELEDGGGEVGAAYRELRTAADALRAVQRERLLAGLCWSGQGDAPSYVAVNRKAWALYRALRHESCSQELLSQHEQMSGAMRELLADAVRLLASVPAHLVRHWPSGSPPDHVAFHGGRVSSGSASTAFPHRCHLVEAGVEREGISTPAFYQPAMTRWPELVEEHLLPLYSAAIGSQREASVARRLRAGQIPRRMPDPRRNQDPAEEAHASALFAAAWEGLETHGRALRAFYAQVGEHADLPDWGHAKVQADALGTRFKSLSGADRRTVRRMVQGGRADPFPVATPAAEPRVVGGIGERTDWFAVQLLDEEGEPVPEAVVTVTASDGSTHEATSDAGGVARVEGLPSGPVTWTVSGGRSRGSTRDPDPAGRS